MDNRILGDPGLLYLATPYSHPSAKVRELRFQAVNKVAARLMRDGYLIFSPISHCHPIAVANELPKEFAFWDKYCREMLTLCAGVVVYRQAGWQYSVGVRAEMELADELGRPISYVDD